MSKVKLYDDINLLGIEDYGRKLIIERIKVVAMLKAF